MRRNKKWQILKIWNMKLKEFLKNKVTTTTRIECFKSKSQPKRMRCQRRLIRLNQRNPLEEIAIKMINKKKSKVRQLSLKRDQLLQLIIIRIESSFKIMTKINSWNNNILHKRELPKSEDKWALRKCLTPEVALNRDLQTKWETITVSLPKLLLQALFKVLKTHRQLEEEIRPQRKVTQANKKSW